MQEVTVRARSSFRHYVTVDAPGKELVWNFLTRRHSLGFGLFRQSTQISTVAPSRRESASARKSSAADAIIAAVTEPAAGNSLFSTVTTRRRGNTVPAGQLSVSPQKASSTLNETPENPGSLESLSPASPPTQPALPQPLLAQSSFHNQDNLIELIPISHFDSAKVTVKGSYLVTEPGVFVLVFDNTFSVNTSKKLFFFVALRDVNQVIAAPQQVEGWILKKGNRKMQGYLKRWLVIQPDGLLSYYKQPGGPPRAAVPLNMTAVRLDHDNLLIDIDTGTSIFHMKAQAPQDFRIWVDCLQSHIETTKFHAPASPTAPLLRGASGYSSMTADSSQFGGPGAGASQPASPEQDLRAIVESHRIAERVVVQVLERVMQMKDIAEAQDSSAFNKLSDLVSDTARSIHALQASLLTLHRQTTSHVDNLASSLSESESAFQSCFEDNNRIRSQHAMTPLLESSFRTAPRRFGDLYRSNSDRHSSSIHSSSIHFYDALENGSDSDLSNDETENSRIVDDAEWKLVEESAEEVVPRGDDNEDSDGADEMHSFTSQADLEKMRQGSETGTIKVNQPPRYESIEAVARRTTLPALPVSMDSINVMSILRNNMGKDFSQIAMPIALNEPLNLLQKLVEELEYCDLLESAAQATDVKDRMVLMSAFAVSGYASTVNRAGRKPFNPLLGETYECIRPDKGFKFVSEKVSHHPPVMACYAESPIYRFYQDNQVKTKFWGKSMELIPTGIVHVSLPDCKDHLTWTKVTTCMRNVFSGTRYLEHYGTMKIVSAATGFSSVITFKESGYFASAKNEVTAIIFDKNGNEVAWMSGHWDEVLYRFEKGNPNNLEVVWRATPCPPHHAQMYGFTQLAVELNELTADLEGLLPITDTRFRPDQRMYENGHIDAAEAEKLRLEQKQRTTRRVMESEGQRWMPRWFEEDGSGEWVYKGGYFESRGKFESMDNIF